MSTAIDYLLVAPDPFALYGFERTFDIDAAQLEKRFADLTEHAQAPAMAHPEKSPRLLQKLAEGHKILSDPVARGEFLLEALGGRSDDDEHFDALPPGLKERLDATAAGANAYADEWRALIDTASNLFRLMDSADHGGVKRARRHQIRQILKGLREIQRRRAAIPAG